MDPALPGPDAIAALPPDGGEHFNRLIFERSPYLLQHARNPVDWYPWGDEAFEKARAEGKPVFLSVGYSTCHWCHVMERESFERHDVAAVLSEHYVAIKVDREERPDVDQIYMAATQLITGRGGWPTSVWLTADREPYYAGTYYPREDQERFEPGYGRVVRPGFKSILRHLAELYRNEPEQIADQARQLVEAVQQQMAPSAAPATAPEGDLLDAAIADLRQRLDRTHGGFSGRPKFPPHQAFRLLFLAHERGSVDALEMALATLGPMADGGVHDHVGGGFHRYSTDERWFLPHFEKMLYDNAQLTRAYADAHRHTGDPRWREVTSGIVRWMLREMRDPAGGLYSALDADSEGEEGTFYVWTPDQVRAVLGAEAGDRFCRAHGIVEGGNWHDEATREAMPTSVVHRVEPEDADHDADREALYEARATRVWPHLDDKVLTAWNGLAIGALAHAGRHLDEPAWVAAAAEAARFVLDRMRTPDGRLLAVYRAGEAKLGAYLDDHAFLADGLLDLHAATGDTTWLDAARELVATLHARFADTTDGGFFFTADDHEDLLVRAKSGLDRAIPSGNGVAARVLARLAALTGDDAHGRGADRTIAAFGDLLRRFPRAAHTLVEAWALRHAGEAPPAEVTVSATVRPADGGHVLAVRLRCAPGWHVQANPASFDHLLATEVTVQTPDGVEAGEPSYPPGEPVTLAEDTLLVYGGTTVIEVPLTGRPDAAELVVTVRYQPCDDRTCQLPRTESLSVPFEP